MKNFPEFSGWIFYLLKNKKMVSQNKIEEFIAKWRLASNQELKARLSTLKNKYKSSNVMAEIKAIQALLS